MWFSRYSSFVFVLCCALITITSLANAKEDDVDECYECSSTISNAEKFKSNRDKACEKSPQSKANLRNITTSKYRHVGFLISDPPFLCEVHLDFLQSGEEESGKRQQFRRRMIPASQFRKRPNPMTIPGAAGANFQCFRNGEKNPEPQPNGLVMTSYKCTCAKDACNGELTYDQMKSLRDKDIK